MNNPIETILIANRFKFLKESTEIKKFLWRGRFRVYIEDESIHQIVYDRCGWGSTYNDLIALIAIIRLPSQQRSLLYKKPEKLGKLFLKIIENKEDSLSKAESNFINNYRIAEKEISKYCIYPN